MKRTLAGLICACVVIAGAALAQQGLEDVQIRAEKVRGNVHVLISDRAGNIGASVGEDGILIIDDKFAPLADKIRAALAGISQSPLKFVLNTHWHGDHTGGNVVFGKEAPIIAHTNVRKRLAEGSAARNVRPAPKEALPVITFDESLSVHFNGEEIKAFHIPHGHTDGDIVLLFTKSNVAHLGDDFFAGRFPFVDIDSGGSVRGLIRGIAHLLEQLPDDVAIIPGHGPVSTKENLREYYTMLVETTEHVRKQMEEGKSLEAILQAGVPERWKSWAWNFINEERWIRIIHRSLTGQRLDFPVPRGRDGHGHPHPH
jgi:cyclase